MELIDYAKNFHLIASDFVNKRFLYMLLTIDLFVIIVGSNSLKVKKFLAELNN